jgi:Ca2+-binding EF-hand superfamily protein
MISLEKCKEVLKESGRKYTEEELKKIREVLYQIATIEYDEFKNKSKEDSSNLHEGIHR